MNKPTKADTHLDICNDLHNLWVAKNHDYGDSFGITYNKFGMTAVCIRLEDKLNRLERLTKVDTAVVDESIDDTLIDLANYAVMAIVERRLSDAQSTI